MERTRRIRWTVVDSALAALAGFLVVALLTGCGSLPGIEGVTDNVAVAFGGRRVEVNALGNVDVYMEAGGSNVPVTDSLNPDVPVYLTRLASGGSPTIPGPGNPSGGSAGSGSTHNANGNDTVDPAPDSTDEAPAPDWSGGDPTGDQTFLWKSAFDDDPANPKIEHGTGVALLPAVIPNPVAGWLEWDGGRLDATSVTRTGDNGNRAHVRFGGEYPSDGVVLVAELPAGDSVRVELPNAHSRFADAL